MNDSSKLAEAEVNEEYILRDAVIGFVVTEGTGHDISGRKYRRIYIGVPVVHSWSEGDYSAELDPDEKILSVVPAPPGTFRVFGLFGDLNNGCYHELGYEFPGASHPDWVEELKSRRKSDPEGKEQHSLYGN